jgi:hypothetical protein
MNAIPLLFICYVNGHVCYMVDDKQLSTPDLRKSDSYDLYSQ